jgi:hypothetical protein
LKRIFIKGRNSINICQSYSNGFFERTYGLWYGFYIVHFLLWFHLNIFYRDSIYETWWKNKYELKKNTINFLTNKQLWTFEWPNLGHIFKSPNLGHFLLDWYIFSPNLYNNEFFKGATFYMVFWD